MIILATLYQVSLFYIERGYDAIARTKFHLDGELNNLHVLLSRRPGLVSYTSNHLHVLP